MVPGPAELRAGAAVVASRRNRRNESASAQFAVASIELLTSCTSRRRWAEEAGSAGRSRRSRCRRWSLPLRTRRRGRRRSPDQDLTDREAFQSHTCTQSTPTRGARCNAALSGLNSTNVPTVHCTVTTITPPPCPPLANSPALSILVCALHGVSPRDRWLCVLPRGR